MLFDNNATYHWEAMFVQARLRDAAAAGDTARAAAVEAQEWVATLKGQLVEQVGPADAVRTLAGRLLSI